MSKKIMSRLSVHWRTLVLYFASLTGLAMLLFYRLGTLVPRFSEPEILAIERSNSLQDILERPLNFPFKFGELLAYTLAPNSVFWARFVAACFGFITVVLFYFLLRRWFDRRLAYVATLLLASSSWFLSYARLAVPDILLALSVVILLGLAWWLHETKRIALAAIVSVVCLSVIVYVPGMIWLIGLGLFTQVKHARRIMKDITLPVKFICIGLVLLLLLPLVRAIAFDVNVLKIMVGWPEGLGIVSFIKELIYVPVSLFVRSEFMPVYNLGRLALLDVFLTAMFILGAYVYFIRFGLVRTKILIAFGVITSLLIALTTYISIIVVIPVIYAIIAGGIMLLRDQWYTVFPRNPIARSLGMALLCIAIATTCLYHVNRYFVAWSHAPTTREVFRYKTTDDLIQ